ncbi:RHS repeat-associated core domain-containing protein [Vibrio cincinnatiensis]
MTWCDHLGTPLRLVTPEGDVVWQAHYETWGEAKIAIERVVNPLRFQGQYYDGETGLHYNLARYYDPRTGRFIQPDPIGLLGGLNHYQYAPNPVMWIDPTGLCAKEDSTLPIDALAENPQQTLITSTIPASYQLSMLAAMQAPAPVPSPSPSPLPSSRPPAIGRINVGAAANDPMYNRLSPKPRLKLLPLAGTASTFLTGMLYSPSLGGSLEEMVAPDGTTYSKYSDERLYKAVGADGEVWQTVDPQEDIAYRAWLANGGDGTFEEWIAQGKPSEIDGVGVQLEDHGKPPFTKYEDRIKQTPVDGTWTGQRGESVFFSNKPEVANYYDEGIRYTNGYPDFSPLTKHQVEIESMSTDRNANFKKADEKLAEKLGVTRKEITKMRKAEDLSWHEVEDMKTMQLMPREPHSKLGHIGGVGEKKAQESKMRGSR